MFYACQLLSLYSTIREFRVLIEDSIIAGLDFHELLDIPQGDRRKYHDDVTVMVISLEGRIWKSSGKYL
jgi:hypothetical protein